MAEKVVLVTGAGRGIGRAVALHFGTRGCAVAINYHHNREEAESLLSEIQGAGGNGDIFQGNVTDESSVNQMIHAVTRRLGKLDYLINNVGNYLKKPVLEVTPQEWRFVLDSNLNSVYLMCREAIPVMQKNRFGRIINIGYASVGKIQAEPLKLPYIIAKNGVLSLTKALAVELAKDNITINMVSPGVMENSLSKPLDQIPMGRAGSYKDLTDAIDYLVNAPYVTGVNLEVAGGWNL